MDQTTPEYDTPTADEAKAIMDKLRIMLPHLRVAVEIAKRETDGGTPGIAIIANSKDGGGRISARFMGDEFLCDLEKLCGIRPLAPEELDLEVKAQQILNQLPRGF